MIKWFAYIVLLLMLAPALLSAKETGHHQHLLNDSNLPLTIIGDAPADTVTSASKNTQNQDDKKKIKEIAKAKRQPKPEKLDDANANKKTKPKRQRRPEGMERPPEIPRRSGD